MQKIDQLITGFDKALRIITSTVSARRPNPADAFPDVLLEESSRRHTAALMRINHVGEVCAQALYNAQASFAKEEKIKIQFNQAGREEEDHLAWLTQRLQELGSRGSLLNPFWYGGAYLLSTIAALLGDAYSLGFVVETERQVEAHLDQHLEKLDAHDTKSRALLEQMRTDERQHGNTAERMGAKTLPEPVKKTMQMAANFMRKTAYYL